MHSNDYYEHKLVPAVKLKQKSQTLTHWSDIFQAVVEVVLRNALFVDVFTFKPDFRVAPYIQKGLVVRKLQYTFIFSLGHLYAIVAYHTHFRIQY